MCTPDRREKEEEVSVFQWEKRRSLQIKDWESFVISGCDRENTEKEVLLCVIFVLRIYWDNSSTPAVEAPLGDFFCNGFGRTMWHCVSADRSKSTGGMNSYFEMPFRERAELPLQMNIRKTLLHFLYSKLCGDRQSAGKTLCISTHTGNGKDKQNWQKDYVILDKSKEKAIMNISCADCTGRYCGENLSSIWMEMKNSRPYPPQVLKIISEVRGISSERWAGKTFR